MDTLTITITVEQAWEVRSALNYYDADDGLLALFPEQPPIQGPQRQTTCVQAGLLVAASLPVLADSLNAARKIDLEYVAE